MKQFRKAKKEINLFLDTLLWAIGMIWLLRNIYLGFLRYQHNQYVYELYVILFMFYASMILLIIKLGIDAWHKIKDSSERQE